MKSSRIRSAVLGAFAAIAVAASSLIVVTAAPARAHAWSAADFEPGNIIDDVLFYRGTGMSATSVQKFLNKRVPHCTLGAKGREVGKKVKWAGVSTRLASRCLKNYRATTRNQPANAYCKAYSGAKRETAAAIIAKVGKACGINPKVLLITLEKEQSLVTDSWPNELQYARATGYECPDSGPGGAAQCDPKQAGFMKQLYGAAWQLRYYKGNPKLFDYLPFQKNRIKWNPKASCGTSTVYIENWATAALYIYTPYRPNKAALKAGWGSGDKCSSYGNRNFFNFWNQWFGSTQSSRRITGSIQKVYNAAGHAALAGTGTAYGAPKSARKTIAANGRGYQMSFTRGVITTSKKYGKTVGLQDSALWKAYLKAGGAAGAWGFLIAEPTGSTKAASDNRRLRVQNGLVYRSTATAGVGTRFVPKPISTSYLAAGGPAGVWGWPKGDARTLGTGKYARTVQKFATGYAFSHQTTKKTAFVVNQAYRDWKARGGGKSKLGFPAASTKVYADGSYQRYAEYYVFFGPKKTLTVTAGAATNAYFAAGGPTRSGWGWPTGHPETAANGTVTQKYANGVLTITKKGTVAFAAR